MEIMRNFNIKEKVMKTYSSIWMLAVFALALGGCGTANKMQTPDAVYYSPAGNQGSTATYRDDNGSEVTTDGDQGQYVTYQDGDNGGYANDYDGLYSNAYNYGSYGLNSYYLSSPVYGYGYGYGLGWNPLAYSMPSLSLMFSMGYPWGGFYRPFAYGGYYNPYMYGGGYYGGYGMYYPGYYSAYYPGYGYGYGYGGGKYLNVNPRPANSYGPRTSSNSRAAAVRGTSVGNRAQGVSAPRRTFGVSNSRGETTRPVSGSTNADGRNSNANSRTRRVFRVNPNERAVNLNTNSRVSNSRSSATPERTETNTRVVERQPVQRQVVERPQRTFEVQRSQPSYSQPTYSAPRSAPTRSFSPRGR